MISAVRVLLLVAFASILAGAPGRAYSPNLTLPEKQTALAQGRADARARLGYPVAGYVLFAAANALVIAPGQGSIDAIIVGTPFERVRYASYLATFQNTKASSDAVAAAAEPDSVDFIVFAHGGARDDQTFLRHYHSARLAAAGRALRPERTTTFGPAEDFFTTTQGKRVFRWLGYETFRFDLRAFANEGIDIAHLRGSFGVVDPYDGRHDYAFDLSKYR